jgi:hypothetical protein
MICTIKDFEKVHKILSHESVYPYISDDYCPKEPAKDLGENFLGESMVKVLMPNNDCVFIFIPIMLSVYHAHMSALPIGRGKIAIREGKQVVEWMFNNTDCVSIIGFIPNFNRLALIYSKLVGLKRIGVIENSFKKNNIFYDQIINGINKGEI